MASVTFSGGFTYCGLIILCLLIVLSVHKVNSSATCVEKFLDGKTAETKHIVTVGERVTLRCDVTARNASRDMVYWKFDDEVMSQDDLVIDKYKSKFNVTLEPKNETLSGKDIYTLSWIAELDDAGKYNCTCTTGGIQYQVWIKRPCNQPKHVINTRDPSTKSISNCTTSPEVLDFLRTNNSYELAYGESLNCSFAFDCNCTWPEVNRTFDGIWYTEDTEDRCKAGERVKEELENATGEQDSSITPIGCYTGKGAVTYRYRNVFGCLNSVFTCTLEMVGKEYGFYIDEGQSTRPAPLFKISCGDCTDDVQLTPTVIVVIITSVLMGLSLIAVITVEHRRQKEKKAEKKVNTSGSEISKEPKSALQKYKAATLAAKVVFGVTIGIGAACLIALVIQSSRDGNCKIPWSRPCACAKCDSLPGEDIVAAAVAGVLTFALMVISAAFLIDVCKPPKPKRNKPEECSQNGSQQVSHNQVHPTVEGEKKPKVMNQDETDTDTPRKKKHSSLRERIPNRVSPAPSSDDLEKPSEPQWDDNERIFANGDLVPVSGSSSGQLSNMTPEKHPRPRLDPIITVPEGGDPLADENAESPRKRKKHRKKKKQRHHRSPSDGENVVDANRHGAEDGYTNPGYVDNETKSTNDASF